VLGIQCVSVVLKNKYVSISQKSSWNRSNLFPPLILALLSEEALQPLSGCSYRDAFSALELELELE
jgi:hypothetical protein